MTRVIAEGAFSVIVRLQEDQRLNCTLRSMFRIARFMNKRFRWGPVARLPSPVVIADFMGLDLPQGP
jgi:hypothetical protein